MTLTPLVAVHMTAALAALAIGPLALWARRSAIQRPKLHRAYGYAWVTLMVLTAASAMFISSDRGPKIYGIGPIHLLIPVTFYMMYRAFVHLARKNIAGHRRVMQFLYVSACVVAGAFTLMPNRYLGHLVWSQFGLV